jgi:hypothetical protein
MTFKLPEWSEYLKLLEPAAALPAQTWQPHSEQLRAEVYKQVLMDLALGYIMYFQADRDHPDFAPFLNSLFLLQPNPDDIYYYAPFDGRGVYRVGGDRGTVKLLTFTVGNNMIGMSETPTPQLGEYDADTLQIAPDGSFEVIFSSERPAGHTGNWLRLDPRAEHLVVRQRSYAWGTERDARLFIERVDAATPLKPAFSAEQIDQRLRGALGFAERLGRTWFQYQNALRQRVPPNTLDFTGFQQFGGVAVQTYWQGVYELREGDALILETDLPQQRPYWNVQLNDPLWNTVEYVYRQSSLNGAQAQLDADGRFRAVIAVEDPGVPNWLDTGGYRLGTLVGRWYACDSTPMPTLKRVPLAEVRDHLPSGTPQVDAAQRAAALSARRRGAQLRRRW